MANKRETAQQIGPSLDGSDEDRIYAIIENAHVDKFELDSILGS